MYLLPQRTAPDFERYRLGLVEEFHDPLTVRQLDAIGVGEGWRCLDAGAGGGSVTRILAERAGASGSVLAIDLDTALLEGLAGGCVEVRAHDLLRDPLPEEEFDLVNARLLLMHILARREAMRRLVAAARPGGWVTAIDPDLTTVELTPTNVTWEQTWSVFIDALVSGGWDPAYGRRLGGDLRAAGLVDVHIDRMSSCGPGGSLILKLLSLTIERLRERMISLGAGNADIDEARRQLEDPANMISSQTTYTAYGRRPA